MATQQISFAKKRRVDWFEELKIGFRTFGIEGATAVLRGDILSMQVEIKGYWIGAVGFADDLRVDGVLIYSA